MRLLRDDLGLTGTKEGCSKGRCGACTVLMDGRPCPACRLTAGDVSECEITTIEGLETPESPHPVQRAFVEAGAKTFPPGPSGNWTTSIYLKSFLL